jgi:NADH:ubiquinone oxidoreductase subunit H
MSLFAVFYLYKYLIQFTFSFPAAAYFLGGKSITFLGLKLQISFWFFFFFLKYTLHKTVLALSSSLKILTLEDQQETDPKQAAILTLPPSVLL